MKKRTFKVFGFTIGFLYNEPHLCIAWGRTNKPASGCEYFSVRSPRTLIHNLKWKAREALRYLQVWPVYFELWSRDCDLCEATYRRRFWTYWGAMRALRAWADDNTEGPCNWRQITKKEYNNFQPEFRDRIGEAFDDGRGTSVIL